MKFSRRFKIALYATLATLYGTGLIVWIMNKWFMIDQGLGPEPRPSAFWYLRAHSTISLWFLILFGYLIHSHVRRGWLAKRKVRTGFSLLVPLCLVIATVPFLLYLNDEQLKSYAVWVHVYVGLALALPYFVHWLTKPMRTRPQASS